MIKRCDEHKGISKVLRSFFGREKDISVITEKVLRHDAVPLFVVGAWQVGKSKLASCLKDRWQNSMIVPVLFSFIRDLQLYDEKAGTLLEQISKKVISCCGRGGEAECANDEAMGTWLDRAEDAVRVVCGKRKKVVILIDDWLVILDRCKELDPRAFADFLNMGITRLREAGANFVFFDKVPRDVLPENISLKLPIGDEYFLVPVDYKDVKEEARKLGEARKLKEKLEPRHKCLWEYVGGDFALVKTLCQGWKNADALKDYERGIIGDVMAERIRTLTVLGVDSSVDAHLLFRSLAEDSRQAADNPVVKELCRMGVIDPSGGGIWMCDAMREYLSRNGGGARGNKKLKVVLKCQSMSVQIGDERPIYFNEETKTKTIQFALLFLLLTDEGRYGHMTYMTFRDNVLGKRKDQYTPLKDLLKRERRGVKPGESRISKLLACLEKMVITRDDVKEAADNLREKVFEPLLKMPECHVIPISRSRDHKTLDDSNWPDFLDIVVVEQ